MTFKNKKVLIFGLGRLGGGVASVKWFNRQKSKILITDLQTKENLADSIKRLRKIKAAYILGRHRLKDIGWADLIVVNPGVSFKNKFIQFARTKNKQVENDCSLFFQLSQNDSIAITGTRGKTTTSTWTNFFLTRLGFKTNLGGNQPDQPLLKIIDQTKKTDLSVVELSSFQLEFYRMNQPRPKIALITNISTDHLNRYQNMKTYVLTKAKIFQNQTPADFLILNRDDNWTELLLKQKPKSQIYFFSLKPLAKSANGLFVKNNFIYFQSNRKLKKLFSVKKFRLNWGEHNLADLLAGLLAVYVYGQIKTAAVFNPKNLNRIKTNLKNLPRIKFRQEVVFKQKNLIVINDSASTSPAATIQALNHFRAKNMALIVGGTDKNLDFKNLALTIKNRLEPKQLILLNGSATKKLVHQLKKIGFEIEEKNICEQLDDCFKKALAVKLNQKIILFSPASASFEKFKNEFDRGEKFNRLIKNLFSPQP